MEKVKKVSFRVRRIYYDQFAAGTKHEELRALTPYWLKILQPAPLWTRSNPTLLTSSSARSQQPKVAVISCPNQPTLKFVISAIWIDEPERILGRELSEQGKKDIPTELCIVTKMGERISDDT
jgi:hypothetical protein